MMMMSTRMHKSTRQVPAVKEEAYCSRMARSLPIITMASLLSA